MTCKQTLTITVMNVNEKRWVHFVAALQVATGSAPGPDYTVIAEGPCYDLWFPVGEYLFQTVESILAIHGIAHNVTSIVAKPQPGDHLVTYNAINKGLR